MRGLAPSSPSPVQREGEDGFTLSHHDVDAGEIGHVQIDDIEFAVAGGDAAEALEALKKRSTRFLAR